MTNNIDFQTLQAASQFNQGIAVKNAFELAQNSYPGDGIVLGIAEDIRNVIQVTWLMRKDFLTKQKLILKPTEDSKAIGTIKTCSREGHSLEDYPVMVQHSYQLPNPIITFGVGNGMHVQKLTKPELFSAVGNSYSYKHDHHSTALISGLTSISLQTAKVANQLSILKKSKNSSLKMYNVWNADNEPGYGSCIHTYANGEGDPLSSFDRQPYLVPLKGNLEEVANFYWDLLNPEYKVSLVVKKISINNPSQVEILIINLNQD